MKDFQRILAALVFLTLPSLPLRAEEGILRLRVVDPEGQAVKVRIGPAGMGPYELTAGDGGARVLLSPQTRPGEQVTLKVLDDDWVIVSPWDARVQVPPFEETTDNVALVVVAHRHQKELLQSGDALHAITRRILTAIGELEESRHELTPAMRQSVLAEQADAFGLSPEDIDRALRAWHEAPISAADRALANEYLAHYPQQILREGSVAVTGSHLSNPVIVTNPKDSPITIEKARAQFELRGDLDQLGLGAQVHLSVGASPPDALDSVSCSWSLEPAGMMSHLSPLEGPCELRALLPVLPPPGRGEGVPVTFGVRVTQHGTVLAELTREAVLANQVLADAVLVGERVGPETPVTISVVAIRSQQVLSPNYECVWDFFGYPVMISPLADNRCKAEISLKPEGEWTGQERILFWSIFRSLEGKASAMAYLRARGTEKNLGLVTTTLRFADIRKNGDRRTARDHMAEAVRSTMEKVLDVALNRDHLEPVVRFQRGTWQVHFGHEDLARDFIAQSRFDDGEWFPIRRGEKFDIPPGSRKLTFQVESDSAGSPELFEYDLKEAALTSLLEEAKSHDRFISCGDEDYCQVKDPWLLPAVRSVSWGIEQDALESTLHLAPASDDFMNHTRTFSHQTFPRPLCGETLFYRLELIDGTRSRLRSVRISRKRTEEHVCPPAGSEFKDPRALTADAAALPVFGYYYPTAIRNYLRLRTFSAPGVEEVRYSYVPGGTRIAADNLHGRAFTLPFKEGVEVIDLDFTLVGGHKVGPFSYRVDVEALRKLQGLYRFSTTYFLNCFRASPGRSRPQLTEEGTLCMPGTDSGDGSEWISVTRIELGTDPANLDFSAQVRGGGRLSGDCLVRDDCLFSFVLPYDTREVFARVRFWHGGWSDIYRVTVR